MKKIVQYILPNNLHVIYVLSLFKICKLDKTLNPPYWLCCWLFSDYSHSDTCYSHMEAITGISN